MKFKKIVIYLLLILYVFPINCVIASIEDLPVFSPSVILIDSDSGKILYAKDIYKKMYPASTTKIMTAILVLEYCDLAEMVTVSYDAIMDIAPGYSTCGLIIGESMSVKDLLYGLILPSRK